MNDPHMEDHMNDHMNELPEELVAAVIATLRADSRFDLARVVKSSDGLTVERVAAHAIELAHAPAHVWGPRLDLSSRDRIAHAVELHFSPAEPQRDLLAEHAAQTAVSVFDPYERERQLGQAVAALPRTRQNIIDTRERS